MASQKFRTTTGLETQEIDMISPDKSDTISVSMSDTDSVIFSGDTGQLMSVTDATSGIICSVNDVSGIPSFEVHDDGTVIIAEGIGNVLIGTDVDSGEKLQVNGAIGAYDIFTNNLYAGAIEVQGPILASTDGIVFPGTAGSITSVSGEMSINSNYVYAKINVRAPLAVYDTIQATNFTGSSAGTNTGDETLSRINALLPDNGKLLFGTGNDASIYYNGTNLIINPKEVGSGSMNVSGDINASTITCIDHLYAPYATTNEILFPSGGSIMEAAGELVIDTNNVSAKLHIHAPVNVTSTIRATNFTGSSAGTNTGDETLSRINTLLPTNGKLLFGTSNAASIYYNGNNLTINPKEVGTGVMDVKGDINASKITCNNIEVTPSTRLTTTSGTLATTAKTAFHDILLSYGGDLTIVGMDAVTGYTQTSKISYSIAGNGNVAYDEYSRIYTYMGALANFSVEYSGMGNSKLYITQFSTNSTRWVVYANSLSYYGV